MALSSEFAFSSLICRFVLAIKVCRALLLSEIDKKFYDSIPYIKKGFQDMYPNLQFEGEIYVDKVIECSLVKTKNNNPLAFFSAGVDSGTLSDVISESICHFHCVIIRDLI